MTKKNFTSINVVLDRSGSMQTILESTIAGFNVFLAEQKKVKGECEISLYQFDDVYEPVYEKISLEKAPQLTAATFVPRGWTALYDAIGSTINSVGNRFAAMEEDQRPDTVIVAIITDGLENKSKQFKADQIAGMIAHQREKYSWDFLFLGANQDAILTAKALNIDAKSSVTFDADNASVNNLFASVARGTTSKRALKASMYAKGASIEEAQVAYSSRELISEEERKAIRTKK